MKISNKKTKLLLIFIISFIVFIGFIIIYSSLSPGTIYFDNGYEESFDIYINGEKIGEVKSKYFLKVEDIKNGKYDIEIKNDGKLIETEAVNVKFGNTYIYNISNKYTYIIVTHEFTKSGESLTGGAAKEIGNKKFFIMPSVDYRLGEKVPEKIEIKEAARVTKTSLIRRVESP
ncbi:hypothetical protein ES703_79012 [subsurface metagenome]